jgi:hypothetical protein
MIGQTIDPSALGLKPSDGPPTWVDWPQIATAAMDASRNPSQARRAKSIIAQGLQPWIHRM